MKARCPIVWALLVALCAAVPSSADTVTGTVRNGTTGQPAADQEVVLIKLEGSMEPIGTFKTDATGRFRISDPNIGQANLLLRVVHQGVNYHTPLPRGQSTAEIEIFDSTQSTAELNVATRLVALQPMGAQLRVTEDITVHNHSKPPRSVNRPQGTFEFVIPSGAEMGQISVAGPARMPLVQGTIDLGRDRYAINYAFRPGETKVTLSYQVPYPQNSAKVRFVSPLSAERVLLIASPAVQLKADGFASLGIEQGWQVWGRQSISANTAFEAAISGTAPPPAEPEGASLAGSPAPSSGASVVVSPPRLDTLKWILLVGFMLIFAVGAVLLWKRPMSQATTAPPQPVVDGTPAPGVANSRVAETLDAIQQQAKQSLDEVKELLLRIEIRKQAGTISTEEYERERARAEDLLRKFLG